MTVATGISQLPRDGQYDSQGVETHKQLGIVLHSLNTVLHQIKVRILVEKKKGKLALQHMLKSKILSQNAKPAICKTWRRLNILYGSVTTVMKNNYKSFKTYWTHKTATLENSKFENLF